VWAARRDIDGGDGLTGLWVLVVEDEAMVLMLVEDYLEELGCEAVGVASRLEDARTLALDVAVLDVSLAGRLSNPVVQALHARGVPVVFATGYGAKVLPPGLLKAAVLSELFQQERLAKALSDLQTRL